MALSILLAVLIAGWLSLVFAGCGTVMIRPVVPVIDSRFLRMAVAYGVGFGATALMTMMLCALQIATRQSIVVMLLVLSGIALFGIRDVMKNTAEFIREHCIQSFRHNKVLSFGLVLLCFGYFCRGLLPPWEFDAIMYHLSIPRFYLEHGGFCTITFNAQADFPMLSEMIYLVCLALGSDSAVKTISVVIAMWLAGLVAWFSRSVLLLDSGKTLLAALLYLTLTMSIAEIASPDVDLYQALWTVLAVIMADRYCRTGSRSLLVVVTILCGMAGASKVFGLFGVVPVAVVFAAHRFPSKQCVAWLIESVVVGVGALLITLPWFVKSYIYKGTLLSIGHQSMVGQGLADPLGVAGLSPMLSFLVNIPGRLLAAPWTFSLFLSQHQGDTFGPLFCTVLPFLFVVGMPTVYRAYGAAALGYFGCVLFMEMVFIQGGSSIRYSSMIPVILSPLVVYTAAHLSWRKTRQMLFLMIGSMILLGGILFVKRYLKDWRALATMQDRETYYRAVLPEYAVIDVINHLNDSRKVMPIYNYSDYLITHPSEPVSRNFSDAAEMHKYLRERNIGYIFANNKLDTEENARAYPQYRNKKIIAAENGFYLYEVTDIEGN